MTGLSGIMTKHSRTVLIIFWTALYVAGMAVNYSTHRNAALEVARASALSSYNKDLVYRRWVSLQGGVYVPVTGKTPPNPLLEKIPERDITTPSGKKLTLINPAYMTRLVHELGQEQYGYRGHITSLDPIRKGNEPDGWEEHALREFEKGKVRFESSSEMGDEKYIRFMWPMTTEESCLKCHGGQGYKAGDIRGGISVSVKAGDYFKIAKYSIIKDFILYTFFWSAGLVLIFIGSGRIKNYVTDLRVSGDVISSQRDSLYRVNEELAATNEELTATNEEFEAQNEELIHSNYEIEQALKEREVLIRELYHRTKNNMQVISSYLGLQMTNKGDEAVNVMLKDIVMRIQSMSLVHEMLYSANDLSRINMKEYTERLVRILTDSYGISGREIRITQNVEDIVCLVDIALPLGLVINEFVSNSLKHAFKDRTGGRIEIEMTDHGDDIVSLVYRDDGSGLPDGMDIRNTSSIGMLTAVSIIENQLNGKFEFYEAEGFAISIMFKNQGYHNRV